MAYEVTATRRRPQRFEDLAGQEYVAETLKNSIKTNQIAHAYLFTGPRGCGKTSTARILAKALNCQSSDKPTCTPCGVCESCKAITNSSSLDVIEIDGASTNSVNDVRQIKDEVMFPPTNSRFKIYIIDEVHMLSTGAFNALLKTIEEPPSHVVFIFATTELQKVPATIKSRCQQYNFRLVSMERLKALLSDAASEMNIQADDEALYWIAKESGGSVRDAYTLFDQVAAFSEGHITYEKIRDKLGLLGVERLNAIFESAANGNAENTLNQLDEFLQSGISVDQIISNCAEYLRSVLLIKNGIVKESLLGQSKERFSKVVLDSWNVTQTERALSIFMQLYRDIRYSLSQKYELELAFSKLCWLKEYVSPAEVKAAIDKAKNLLLSENGTAQTEGTSSAILQTASEMSQSANSVATESRFGSDKRQNQTAQTKMPHFSFLENPPPRPEKNEEAQNPFRDGGALPPEKNKATETENYRTQEKSDNNSEKSNSDLENSVPKGMPTFSALEKLNSSKNNPTPNIKIEMPEQNSDFAYLNPNFSEDDANSSSDDYQNYAPDDFSENEEVSERAKETFLEEQNESFQDGKATENLKGNQTPILSPDGTSITVEKLYGTVVADFAVSNAMLASAIMETKNWDLAEPNKITATIGTEYQQNFIQQNIQILNQEISKICKKSMIFEIIFKDEKKSQDSAELPLQVKILCNVFKGSVLGK